MWLHVVTVGMLVHNCIISAFQLAILKAYGCNVAIVRKESKGGGKEQGNRGYLDGGQEHGGNEQANRGWSTRVDGGNNVMYEDVIALIWIFLVIFFMIMCRSFQKTNSLWKTCQRYVSITSMAMKL